MLNSYEIGVFGERQARKYLRRKGYKILAVNYKTVFGELDIIATKGSEVIFCEVKTRGESSFGAPIEFVNDEKVMRIKRTAAYFLKSYKVTLQPRIDVIEVYTKMKNTSNTYYWTGSGTLFASADKKIVAYNNQTTYVRCVYDEWYWGSEQLTNKTTFTWGDMPR